MGENKQSFMGRQKTEAQETQGHLSAHAVTIRERLVQEPESDELREALDAAEEGVKALEPVLEDFNRSGVDPNELVKYAQVIEEWQEKEKEIASLLGT